MEQTLSIIKPDAVRRNLQGKILSMMQNAGFKIIAQKMTKFSLKDAEKFYEIHKERPFYNDLCEYMSSGPISVQILQKENAVEDHRDLMGATNPKDAQEGTIRKAVGISIDENSVHGSDSIENAKQEIKLIFNEEEIFINY